MSDSVRPHRRQPTSLPHPWDSPGKDTGVGCHFLLQCMKVKSEREVAQSCLTLRDPMDCSPPGSSICGIFQATVLEWGATAFSNIYIIYIFFKFEKLVLFILEFWIHTISFQVNSGIEIRNNYDPIHKKVNHYVVPLKLIQCCTSALLLFSH